MNNGFGNNMHLDITWRKTTCAVRMCHLCVSVLRQKPGADSMR